MPRREEDLERSRTIRLQIIENLSLSYGDLALGPNSPGYYGGFLSKLYRVLFGAAKDFGLAPRFFLLVSESKLFGNNVGGLGIATEDAGLRSFPAIQEILEQALKNVVSLRDSGDTPL